eukprot:scaffold14054_cov103-Skeletonema_dohrnii-CCMP3373.AAC.2
MDISTPSPCLPTEWLSALLAFRQNGYQHSLHSDRLDISTLLADRMAKYQHSLLSDRMATYPTSVQQGPASRIDIACYVRDRDSFILDSLRLEQLYLVRTGVLKFSSQKSVLPRVFTIYHFLGSHRFASDHKTVSGLPQAFR